MRALRKVKVGAALVLGGLTGGGALVAFVGAEIAVEVALRLVEKGIAWVIEEPGTEEIVPAEDPVAPDAPRVEPESGGMFGQGDPVDGVPVEEPGGTPPGVSAGGVKFPDAEELARRLNTTKKVFETTIKKEIRVQFSKELRREGIRNPDVGVGDDGMMWLRDPNRKHISFETDVPLSSYSR